MQPEEFHRTGVADFAGDDMVAAAQEGQRQRGNGGHAGGGDDGGGRAFERGQTVFERAQGGIAPAGVGVRRAGGFEHQRVEELDAEGRQFEGGRHVQRQPQRAGGWVGFFASVHGEGVKFVHEEDLYTRIGRMADLHGFF